MTATTYTRSGSTFVASNRLILIVYTVSIFVSALLLFSVQPLFTKMILPRLGGSPAVWSIAMVFFQSLLLFGYAYAHYLMTIRNRMIPVIVHLTLLIIALLTLPLAIGESWSSPPESGYALWLLGLFAVTIGLPFFALAANNPLLQAWFVRAGHPAARDPYFLYASSNIGSFLALLSYPVLLEPMLSLRMQNLLWTSGYRVDRRLWSSTAARTALSDGRERHRRRCRPGRKLGRARALDIPRSGAIRLAYRGLRAQFDRRRRGAVALGASAFDLSADLGIGISGPPPVAPSMDVAAATACHCMHHCAA